MFVDGVGGEYFACVLVENGDGVVVDEHEGGGSCPSCSDAELVEFAGVSEGEFAVFGDFVEAYAVVRGGEFAGVWLWGQPQMMCSRS